MRAPGPTLRHGVRLRFTYFPTYLCVSKVDRRGRAGSALSLVQQDVEHGAPSLFALALAAGQRRCDGRTAARSRRSSGSAVPLGCVGAAHSLRRRPRRCKLAPPKLTRAIGGLAAARRLGVAVVDGAAGADPVLDDAAAPVRGSLHNKVEREPPGLARAHDILCRVR
eukprot:scaffold80017_cov71-Phaeocystis_antarctica.AAC.1